MKNQTKRPRDCFELEKVLLECADEDLTPEQKKLRREHLAVCPNCRAEVAAIGAVRFDGSSGPFAPLDDISRRRLVDDILDSVAVKDKPIAEADSGVLGGAESVADSQAGKEGIAEDRVGEQEEDENEPDGYGEDADPAPRRAEAEKRRGNRFLKVAGVIAALVVAAGTAGFVLWRFFLAGGPSPVQDKAKFPAAEVVLVSGGLETRAGAVGINASLKEGRVVLLRSGRAALRLPDRSIILMEGRTEIELTRLERRRVELRLREGVVIAWAAPEKRRLSFVIRTQLSTVKVKGTIFRVKVGKAEEEVSVHRGRVEVSALRSHESVAVSRGGTASLKGGEVEFHRRRDFQGDEFSGVEGLIFMLSGSPVQTAGLHVKTEPAGAIVMLDGTVIGETPVFASVNPGFRSMVVRKEGYSQITEGVDLRREGAVNREYILEDEINASNGRGPHITREPEQEKGEEASLDPTSQRIPDGDKHLPTPRPSGDRELGASSKVAGEHLARRLLAEAQRARGERRFKDAVKAYQKLVRRYPGRAEARPALVSMGRLFLGPLGKPGEALKAFDGYLSITRHGTLAQEASYGRIKALRALGRRKEEIKALQSFLRRFPGAIQVESVKRRLEKLKKSSSEPMSNKASQGSEPEELKSSAESQRELMESKSGSSSRLKETGVEADSAGAERKKRVALSKEDMTLEWSEIVSKLPKK